MSIIRKKRQTRVHGIILLLFGFVLGAGVIYIVSNFRPITNSNETATVPPRPPARITFTFDDGFKSSLSEAAPVLAKYNIPGVIYVSTGCTENTGPCRQRFPPGKTFLTWDDLHELKNKYNWEIGSHAHSHIPLSTLSIAEKEKEIVQSKELLKKNGFDAVNFATPQGDYDPPSLALIMREHATHRSFHDIGANDTSLFNNALLSIVSVQEGVTVEEVKEFIGRAIELEQWVVLSFHDIKSTPSNNPLDYEFSTTKLEEIAKYVQEQHALGNITPVTVTGATLDSRQNLIGNHTFERKDGFDWIVSSATSVHIDDGNHGSYPSALNAARLIGSPSTTTLYTRLIPVDQGLKYELKLYVNAASLESGELNIVIDEHKSSGEWIKAHWIGNSHPGEVKYLTGSYTPSSPTVDAIRVQADLSKNAKGSTYVDNFQLYKVK